MSSESKVIHLPSPKIGRSATVGASWFAIRKSRIREWLGRRLNALGVPGAIQAFDIQDAVTGQQIAVQIGTLYVRLSVNGRDYYFNRLTGRFDGTGSGCG